MIRITIPGYKTLELAHLVLDFNGTMARDGALLPGVRERLEDLAGELRIHVLTADTFGKARSVLRDLPCTLEILSAEDQATAKLAYVQRLGPASVVCIGNGRNDRLMLRGASLGIAVIQEEGAAMETLMAADIVCASITSALELLSHPLRLIATLRS